MSDVPGVSQDTPMSRATILELPIQEAEAFLAKIREKRMYAYSVYEQAVKAKAAARADKITASVHKAIGMMQKEIAALDKAEEKVRNRINKIRALILQLED